MRLVVDTSILFSFFNKKSRARELSTLGELQQAIELFRAALEKIGSLKCLKSEMLAVENSISKRDKILRQVGNALESSDYKKAADWMDKTIDEGDSPAWLLSLRREVGSLLDAGAAALIEVGKLMREGKTTDARLGLISLLSRKETREEALDLWNEINKKEAKAATLFGHAEAISMDPCVSKSDLLEARKAVNDAAGHRADHPQFENLRNRIHHKIVGWDKYEEAASLEINGQLDSALTSCRQGLQLDPTHPALRNLFERMAKQRAKELVQEAETHITAGKHDKALPLLTKARELASFDAEIHDQIRRLVSFCSASSGMTSPAAALPIPAILSLPEDSFNRFVLRIEEGPEALVLTEDTIHIGNARNPDNQIALMANISSSHATLIREFSFQSGVTYSLRAERGKDCRINGKRIREGVLIPGDEIQLGRDVHFRFLLPDPGSATAVLDILKGFHMEDVRKILLMKRPGKDGRIRIGYSEKVHVLPPQADRIVELFFDDLGGSSSSTLMAKAEGGLEVDGLRFDKISRISMGAYVCSGPCHFQIGRPQ